jgi:hypothetical protein
MTPTLFKGVVLGAVIAATEGSRPAGGALAQRNSALGQ